MLEDVVRLLTAVLSAVVFVWLMRRGTDQARARGRWLYFGSALLFAAAAIDSVNRLHDPFIVHLTPVRLAACLCVLYHMYATHKKVVWSS